jgi:lysophospholipase L1-like esterase
MRTTVLFLLFGVVAGFSAADAVEPAANVSRLYVIGDSTAASYGADRYPRLGWAQELQQYFDAEKVIVENKARSGRSAKSFFEEGAWAEMQAALTDRDYVVFQFGHND